MKLKSNIVNQLRLDTDILKTRNLTHPINQTQDNLTQTNSNFLSPMRNRDLEKVNTSRDSNFKHGFMNSKAAEQSARLRKRIEDIHTRNKKRVKDKHKVLQKNREKLETFQQKLMCLDKDPKSPMSRRRSPGNYIHSPTSSSRNGSVN